MTSIVIIYKIGFGARHYDLEIHESCLQFGFQAISYSKNITIMLCMAAMAQKPGMVGIVPQGWDQDVWNE